MALFAKILAALLKFGYLISTELFVEIIFQIMNYRTCFIGFLFWENRMHVSDIR